MKTTKQTPYWLYFLNQGFFSKNKFVAPYPLNYEKENEMVITIDRKIGILTYWIKGTDHVLAIWDDRLCTGDVVPVYVHRKDESWVKLKWAPEEQEEEEEVRSGTAGTHKSKSKFNDEEEEDN